MPSGRLPAFRSVVKAAPALPAGFVYRPGFLPDEEERALAAEVERLPFGEIRMHGITAKRRAAHYGWMYGYESWKIQPGPPIPGFLLDVRARVAGLAGVAPDELAEVLITEYPPGAGIGWHRDAPAFGLVAAVSLEGSCRMRFRKGTGAERETAELTLEPRSAYVIDGEARSEWQHSIPPGRELRYSITFRTLRRKRA